MRVFGGKSHDSNNLYWSIRELLVYVNSIYGQNYSGQMFIEDQGFEVENAEIGMDKAHTLAEDFNRRIWYETRLNQVLKFIQDDSGSTEILGFSVKFLDGFEYENWFDVRTGVVAVDFTTLDRPRSLKDSAIYVAEIARNLNIPEIESNFSPKSKSPVFGVTLNGRAVESFTDTDLQSNWDEFTAPDSNYQKSNSRSKFLENCETDLEKAAEIGLKRFTYSLSWSKFCDCNTCRNTDYIKSVFQCLNHAKQAKIHVVIELSRSDVPSCTDYHESDFGNAFFVYTSSIASQLEPLMAENSWKSDDFSFVSFGAPMLDITAGYIQTDAENSVSKARPDRPVQFEQYQQYPPGVNNETDYQKAVENVAYAHKLAYSTLKTINSDYGLENIEIGISLNVNNAEPMTDKKQADHDAVKMFYKDSVHNLVDLINLDSIDFFTIETRTSLLIRYEPRTEGYYAVEDPRKVKIATGQNFDPVGVNSAIEWFKKLYQGKSLHVVTSLPDMGVIRVGATCNVA